MPPTTAPTNEEEAQENPDDAVYHNERQLDNTIDTPRDPLYIASWSNKAIKESMPCFIILPQRTLSCPPYPHQNIDFRTTFDGDAPIAARRLQRMAEPCVLCLDRIKVGYEMGCGHIACEDCMIRWLRQQRTCPTCRWVGVHSEGKRVALGTDERLDYMETFHEPLGKGDLEGWRKRQLTREDEARMREG